MDALSLGGVKSLFQWCVNSFDYCIYQYLNIHISTLLQSVPKIYCFICKVRRMTSNGACIGYLVEIWDLLVSFNYFIYLLTSMIGERTTCMIRSTHTKITKITWLTVCLVDILLNMVLYYYH